MEKREYIKIAEPISHFPTDINLLRELNNDFWKDWVLYYLLDFYKNYNAQELLTIIQNEQTKKFPRTERELAKYLRKHLKNNIKLNLQGFKVIGEATNDEDIEGNYDMIILHSYWEDEFYFECKNLSLNSEKALIKKYIYTKIYPKGQQSKKDGGVYRYFNGKYAQSQNFGGMLGFVLGDDIQEIKNKIINDLNEKFDTTPEGDLKQIHLDSIQSNNFTFDSVHYRKGLNFTLHHILFDFVK
ncbi:hypothetical protein C8N46_11352 [Kordia periserrulae]|uniref:Uncharacterized protein n=1 Tax=Kordia periserrulae TaxID=701523 RepID=A0A2T6BR36_9FLAO|nr:hypothetical protein [Kordia periserrulae]PTX58561.1 hypothetical protein C8N46_11352 [Kordia periserrulae]